VKVLGEAYTQEDDEDMAIVEVSGISVSVGRFFIEVNSAVAGNWYINTTVSFLLILPYMNKHQNL